MTESLKQKSERLISITKEALMPEITESQMNLLRDEAEMLFGDLFEEFDNLKLQGCKNLPPDGYFDEKLAGVRSFVRIALGTGERGGYTDKEILENVKHYTYRVQSLATKWD